MTIEDSNLCNINSLSSNSTLEISSLRAQFPIFNTTFNDELSPLVYLDSAATAQKPQCVIDAISEYYTYHNANVHRSEHSITANLTSKFENARVRIAGFINASSSAEIIFTKGATEALNLIANSYALANLQAGDEILIGEMEHHANIVPWQIIAKQTGAKIIKIPMLANCQLDLDAYQNLLSHRCKIVALAHISNVTGTRQPIEQMIKLAHQYQSVVVIDGAQAIMHEKIDVTNLDADFYVFSGHKIYGPTGVGILYGKKELLENMPVWQGGGKMVTKVSFNDTKYTVVPHKFEAGTPNIAGVIGLDAAISWYSSFDQKRLTEHLYELQEYAYKELNKIKEVQIIGYQEGSSIISFIVADLEHQDIAIMLDKQGILVRAGNHCAHPFMEALGISGTVRISFAVYNNRLDVTKFITALQKAIELLS